MAADDVLRTIKKEYPFATGSGVVQKAVTPDDANDLPDGVCRRLFCGSGGTVKVSDAFGNVAVWAVPPAFEIELYIARVWDAETDCTGMIAIY